MSSKNLISLARTIVGEGNKSDYIIAPTRHSEEFRDKAPELAEILNSSEVIAISEQYENKDQEALAAQKEFKHVFNRANISVFITAILIALILAIGIVAPLLPDLLEKVLLIGLSIGSVITGALASKDLNIIRQGKLLEEWMTRRAAAETTRLEYFYTVARLPEPVTTSGFPVALLKLEYFRRFQLDVQRAYYRKRAKEHRQSAKKTLSYSTWAMAGATIVTGLAGVLGGALNAQFAVIGALGTIFTAFSYFAAMKEEVYQNQRNAERYARTSQALEALSMQLDRVRKAVYAAGEKPLTDFIEAIHEQLSLEHRQWIDEQSQAQSAFVRLEETLRKISSESQSNTQTII